MPPPEFCFLSLLFNLDREDSPIGKWFPRIWFRWGSCSDRGLWGHKKGNHTPKKGSLVSDEPVESLEMKGQHLEICHVYIEASLCLHDLSVVDDIVCTMAQDKRERLTD